MAPELLLHPGDVIDLSVFAQGDLSRSYRIRSDGTVSLHLVGTVPAAGMTVEGFEAALEARLAEVLTGPVSATVEVVSYRPVAVLGYVREPGLHPFSEGLDVGRAVALAGGFPIAETGATIATNAAMRVAEEEQQYQQLRAGLAALLIERARLLAERDGATEVAPVPEAIELIGTEKAAKLADEQARLLTARRELFDIRLRGEEDRKDLAQLEADSFASRREITRRQLETTLSDLADQEALRERGLAVASRLLELRLEADTYRSAELESAAFEAAALQEKSSAGYTAQAMHTDRTREIGERLSEIEQQVIEIRAELAGTRDFLSEFGGQDALLESGASKVVYRLLRRSDATVEASEVDAASLLLPGDTLEVVVESVPGEVESAQTAENRDCISCDN